MFICGGRLANLGEPVASLRDAFMRVIDKSALAKGTTYLAEDPTIFSPIGEYTELLKFEADIAQLTELLVLFCESAGSMVELGMFVMDDEVSPKLMVVIDDKNYKQNSFIKLGPIFSLTNRHGNDSVCVLNLQHLNIPNIESLGALKSDNLLQVLDDPLKKRLKEKREPATFNKNRHGHVTKLIMGLVQHYASLTFDEIETLLYCLDVPTVSKEVRRHIQCAERFGWLHVERVGTDDYCAPKPAALLQAIDFDLLPGSPIKDKMRWRSAIRDYWKTAEPMRFNVIANAMRSGK